MQHAALAQPGFGGDGINGEAARAESAKHAFGGIENDLGPVLATAARLGLHLSTFYKPSGRSVD
ncbi:hypothetical protein HPGCJGGD_3679 [Methylobacterium haplocladii]|nr:hypothetical protein HPGCJGGD_3679 [Methylobacterium haplocladii]